MTWNGWLQISVFFLAILACAKPLGSYIASVMTGRCCWLSSIERLIYRICFVSPDREQRWTQYAASLLAFILVSCLLIYFLQGLLGYLPLKPRAFAGTFTPDSSFNTSFS